jgi:UDP-glucose 4-epimerase
VYGEPDVVPVDEGAELDPKNPYGRTKLCVEHLLSDLRESPEFWDIMVLRYFNPVAVHPSGRLGNNSADPPSKLMPNLLDVAAGEKEVFSIFGDDYPTKDGTPVRDYIHIMDLVDGHLAALEKMDQADGHHVYNLGTGTGYSVLEVIETFQEVTGQNIPYEVEKRRPGDAARVYADPSKAHDELNWSATRDLADMCADAWWGKHERIAAD